MKYRWKLEAIRESFKAADIQDLHRQPMPGGDGIINLNTIHGNHREDSFEELNPEYVKAREAVNLHFGIANSKFAVFDVLRYFDNLDGLQDNLIHMDAFSKFVDEVRKGEGDTTQKFVEYLITSRSKIEKEMQHAPPSGKQIRQQHIDELNVVIMLFEETES